MGLDDPYRKPVEFFALKTATQADSTVRDLSKAPTLLIVFVCRYLLKADNFISPEGQCTGTICSRLWPTGSGTMQATVQIVMDVAR